MFVGLSAVYILNNLSEENAYISDITENPEYSESSTTAPSNPDDFDDDDDDGERKNSNSKKMGKQKGSSSEKMPNDVAKKLKIKNVKKFNDYLHKVKKLEGRGGADNYTWDELIEIGEEFIELYGNK